MNAKLLSSSIETLKSLRLELRNGIENNVLEMLDEAIFDLEQIQHGSDKISASKVLHILGQVLEKLPIIVELFHILSDVVK